MQLFKLNYFVMCVILILKFWHDHVSNQSDLNLT